MALSAQTVAQKSLNEFLPLCINFFGPHRWLSFFLSAQTLAQKSLNASCHYVSIFWGPIYGLISAQTLAQKSLNEFLPSDVHFWGAIYGFIRPDSGREVPERVPATTYHIFVGPIYGLCFRPDRGAEVPERVPATMYQFLRAPSMAFSAQTVGQKSLNECLPPDVHFWGAIYGFIHPDSGTEVLTDIYPPAV